MKINSKHADRRKRTENKIKARIREADRLGKWDVGFIEKRAKTRHPLSGETRRETIDWERSEIPIGVRRKMFPVDPA